MAGCQPSKKIKLDLRQHWNITAILDESYSQEEIPLIEAQVAFVAEKRNISKAVKFLCENWPLHPKYLFLKRVKAVDSGAEIIISIGESHISWCPPETIGLSLTLCCQKLPSRPPLSRTQFHEAQSLWPCHFHENQRLEAILAQTLPEIWSWESFQLHSIRMQVLLQKATSMAFGVVFNAIGVKVAEAFETKSLHPLQHCAMNLIDSVAHSHGGGAWPSNEASKVERPDYEAYLLTGCDVYLSNEPCIMCSMALVHSRVGRVFFSKANHTKGGLCSLANLQAVKGLNHSFEVYSITRK